MENEHLRGDAVTAETWPPSMSSIRSPPQETRLLARPWAEDGLQAVTRQGKRQYVRGVSVMRTEIVFRRNAYSNITVPCAVTRDSRGTVFSQPLRLESDGMEELMMPGRVSIANCHEHTAGCISTRAVGRQTGCRMNCRQPVQQYQVDDRWPSRPGKGGQSQP